MTPLSILLPLRVRSGDNSHVHWRTKAHSAKAARAATYFAFRAAMVSAGLRKEWADGHPLTVTLRRIAPRPLDTDGLSSALKPVRDELARCLGMASDTGPRVAWVYVQERGKSNAHLVGVVITPRSGTCANCGAPLAVAEPGAWDLEHCPSASCIYRAPKRRRHA